MAKKGGAWKVAYADFVTAMMAFFLVMWITAQSKEVKESVSSYFEDPLGSSDHSRLNADEGATGAATVGPVPNGGLHTRGLAEADPNSAQSPDGDNLSINKPKKLRIFERSDLSYSIGTMVLFDETTEGLNDAARAQLDTIIPALRGKPNKIEIRGHSSRKPLPEGSKYRDGWELSYARCTTVMDYMAERGIDRNRFRLSQEGPSTPYSLRRDKKWQELNSRVQVFAINEFTIDHDDRRTEAGGFFGELEPADEKTSKARIPGAPAAASAKQEPSH